MEVFRLKSIINPFSEEETLKDLERAYKQYKQEKKIDHLILNNNLEIVRNPGDFRLALENNLKSMPGIRERKYSLDSEFPLRMDIETTSICNSKCRMCVRNLKKREDMHLSFEDFKNIADQMKDHKLIDVYLYRLGEPMLNPELPKMLNYIKNFDNIDYLWISSNGLDLSAENVNMLLDSNVTIFNMSINAMNSEEYMKINGIENAKERYYDMINNFENAIKIKKEKNKRKPFFRVQMIENAFNKGCGVDFIKEWEEKADIINVGTLEYSSKMEFNNEIKINRERKEVTMCSKLYTSHFFLHNDGSVVPCMQDFNAENIKIGDWRKQTIKEIYNSEKYKNFIKLHLEGKKDSIPFCAKCIDYDL